MMSKDRSRRIAFGLWFLFVLLGLIAVPLGWLAWRFRDARARADAVVVVQQRLGTVIYDHQEQWVHCEDDGTSKSGGIQVTRRAKAAPPGPAWLRSWLGDHFFFRVSTIGGRLRDEDVRALTVFRELDEFAVYDEAFTDEGMACVASFQELTDLYIASNNVTDEGLVHIRSLTGLRSLSIKEARITDAGLRHLAELTKLEYLQLAGTEIRGDGLRHISRCKQLKELKLDDTPITDAAFPHLSMLTNLEQLDLSCTQVSGKGLRQLAELPNLLVLNLTKCPVPDDAVGELKTLKRLCFLGIDGTQVSPNGAELLEAELPNCTVVTRFETVEPKWQPPRTLKLRRENSGLDESGLRYAAIAEQKGGAPYAYMDNLFWPECPDSYLATAHPKLYAGQVVPLFGEVYRIRGILVTLDDTEYQLVADRLDTDELPAGVSVGPDSVIAPLYGELELEGETYLCDDVSIEVLEIGEEQHSNRSWARILVTVRPSDGRETYANGFVVHNGDQLNIQLGPLGVRRIVPPNSNTGAIGWIELAPVHAETEAQ